MSRFVKKNRNATHLRGLYGQGAPRGPLSLRSHQREPAGSGSPPSIDYRLYLFSGAGYHELYNGVVCNDTILATGVFSSKELWMLSKGTASLALFSSCLSPYLSLSPSPTGFRRERCAFRSGPLVSVYSRLRAPTSFGSSVKNVPFVRYCVSAGNFQTKERFIDFNVCRDKSVMVFALLNLDNYIGTFFVISSMSKVNEKSEQSCESLWSRNHLATQINA